MAKIWRCDHEYCFKGSSLYDRFLWPLFNPGIDSFLIFLSIPNAVRFPCISHTLSKLPACSIVEYWLSKCLWFTLWCIGERVLHITAAYVLCRDQVRRPAVGSIGTRGRVRCNGGWHPDAEPHASPLHKFISGVELMNQCPTSQAEVWNSLYFGYCSSIGPSCLHDPGPPCLSPTKPGAGIFPTYWQTQTW